MNDVVVFVHSTGTGPMLFREIPPAAIGERVAIHHGNLGYPPGPPIPRGQHVSVHDDVAALLRRVPEGSRVHLVGHSYGGLVALLAGEALGARVASMFLYEPVLFHSFDAEAADDEARAELAGFAAHPWFLDDEARGGGREWLRIFVDYWNAPGSWDGFPDAMQAALLTLGWKMFMEVRSCFAETKRFSEWALPAATTIAYGERSPAASRGMARALAAGRPNVSLVGLPDVGHMAPLTEPGVVYDAIAAHFRR